MAVLHKANMYHMFHTTFYLHIVVFLVEVSQLFS